MANEGIEVEIYGPANNYATKLGTLYGAQDPEALEEIKAFGGGSFKISKTDKRLSANPTWIKSRNICKLRVDGVVTNAFFIDEKETIIVGAGEAAEQGYLVYGQGLKNWFDDAEVRPVGGIKPLSQKTRYFNFASVDEGPWYVSGSWTNPVNQGQVKTTPAWGSSPDKWPDIAASAQWIWVAAYTSPAPFDPCYFRHTVNITTAGTHAVYSAVDDYFELYVDGQKIAASDPKTSSHYEASRVEVQLSTGTHVIAYMAKNTEGLAFNGPAALAMALVRVAADKSETLISRSGAGTWKCMAYPAVAPGWSIGEVLITLMNEAGARGVVFPSLLTKTFTTTTDSNSTAWVDKLEWSFKIGESLASVVKKFEELVDIWIDPATMQLHCAQVRGKNKTVANHSGAFSQPISFLPGKHIVEARTQSRGKIKNAMSILTTEGWIEQNDASLPTSPFGRLEASIDTGATPDFAKKIASSIFAQRSIEEEGASYDLITQQYTPGVNLFVGDWVLAPNAIGLQVARRVMSIAVKRDSAGRPKYTIEFDTIFRSNEQALTRIVEKLGGGGVGGSSSNVPGFTPGVGDPILLPPPVVPQLLIPQAPTGVNAASVGFWDTNGVNPYSLVDVFWNVVTQHTDLSPAVIAYYEVEGRLTAAPADAWTPMGTSTSDLLELAPFTVGSQWTFRVRAHDVGGGVSSWGYASSHTMLGPTTPMAAPMTPTLSSDLGNLVVVWNGLLAGSTQPPVQFRYVFAEVSTAATGQPWTRKGPALSRGGGQIVIPGETVGENRYARLTAVDGMGIASAASSVAGPQMITGVDLGDLDASVGAAIDAAENAALAAKEGTNMLSDPSFELNTEEFWDILASTTNATDQFHTGARSMKTTTTGGDFDAIRYQRTIPVEPGERYYFRIWMRPSSITINGFRISIQYGPTTGLANNEDIGDGSQAVVNTWNMVTAEWTVPSGQYFMRPRIVIRDSSSGNFYWYDDFYITKMVGTTEIIGGSITASKIASDSITSAHIQAGAVDAEAIQAAAVTAGKIAAGAVTANEIAAGAITANHIQAGAITTSHLQAGIGGTLDISANSSVNILVSQIAAVDANADATQSELESMQQYYSFGTTGAVISKPGSVFATRIDNDSIDMLENGNVISYWNSGQMFVTQLVAEKLTMGNHQVETYGTGTIVRAL